MADKDHLATYAVGFGTFHYTNLIGNGLHFNPRFLIRVPATPRPILQSDLGCYFQRGGKEFIIMTLKSLFSAVIAACEDIAAETCWEWVCQDKKQIIIITTILYHTGG